MQLVLLLLATWRVAAFLAYEHWTEGLRLRLGVEMVDENGWPVSFLGKWFSCFWCLTASAAAICWLLVLADAWGLITLLGCSGGAILLNYQARVFRYMEE